MKYFARVLLLSVSVFASAGTLQAQELQIGILEKTPSQVHLYGSSNLESVLKRLTTRALSTVVFDQEVGGVRLDLASSYSVRSDGLEHVFKLRPNAAFQNGERVVYEDVLSSLRLCPTLQEVLKEGKIEDTAVGQQVVLQLSSKEAAPSLLERLAECPIVEGRSSSIFGSLLGYGNFYLGTGSFRIDSYSPGKRYRLSRALPAQNPLLETLRKVEVLTFHEWHRALTAIRMGSVQMLLADQEDLLEKARDDATLEILTCNARTLIVRRGIEVICGSDRWINTVRLDI